MPENLGGNFDIWLRKVHPMSVDPTKASTVDRELTDDWLCTDRLRSDLRRRVISGGAVIVTAQVAKFFLGMLSAAIIARLLDPVDF